MNPSEQTCILIVQDSVTSAQLRQQLGSAGYTVLEAITGEQALALVAEQPVDAAIIETDLPAMNGLDLCRGLRQSEYAHDLPVLILTSRGEISDKVAGFEAGADDYLTKPYQPQELGYRLRTILARRQKTLRLRAPAQSRGRIVALFGTKGGVGRTTIGVNLSIGLQRRTHAKVLYFDGDFFFGDAALHFGLPPSHTILDLIEHMDNLDSEVLDRVLIPHTSGVRVLMSPRKPEDVELITPSQVTRLLDRFTETEDYVIVDCQAIYDERTLVALEKADAILLVIKPEVGCVKNMAVFYELAAKLGLSFDKKVHIVLNRSNSKSGVVAKDIERIFRRPIAFHIGSGGNAVVMSVNRGTPLIVHHPNHHFSLQVQQVADYIVKLLPAPQRMHVPHHLVFSHN